jgi:hypothetical protein
MWLFTTSSFLYAILDYDLYVKNSIFIFNNQIRDGGREGVTSVCRVNLV